MNKQTMESDLITDWNIDNLFVESDNNQELTLQDKLSQDTQVVSMMMMRLDEECIAHLTLCTICFSTEADLELMNCGDQLCFDCLEQ